MRALISIDYTNDFVASDGALTTGKAGQKIEKKMIELTETFTKKKDYVVYAIDGHDTFDSYHPEAKLFPPHNIIGTEGRELFGGLQSIYEKSCQNDTVYWLNKRHYSAFSGTDLDIRLRERKITEIHLIGVCTDICVLHTAVDAYNLGYSIVVHRTAVASFDSLGHTWALNHFEKTLGALIID